jgi:hypothetical protein
MMKYPPLLIRALIFRQDYRMNKIFLPLQPPGPLPAQRPEWQKASSLF